MSSGTPTSAKAKKNWLTRKFSFYLGLILGGFVGFGLSAAISFIYLMASQDSISVKNGQVNLSKPVSITTNTNTDNGNRSTDVNNTANLNPQGDKSAVANSGAVANTGDKSDVARDRTNSPTTGGNVINVTNVMNVPNRDLPGFNEKAYLVTPPSDLTKYSQVNDLQPDALVQSASDSARIQFGQAEIVIGGKIYRSFFNVDQYANESRFIFKLDGTQRAALLQFGLPDLSAGSTSQGAYIVKISSDGQPLWAGECKRSQGNQILSVPLDVSGKRTLAIEVTSNRNNESRLFFTKASVLKN